MVWCSVDLIFIPPFPIWAHPPTLVNSASVFTDGAFTDSWVFDNWEVTVKDWTLSLGFGLIFNFLDLRRQRVMSLFLMNMFYWTVFSLFCFNMNNISAFPGVVSASFMLFSALMIVVYCILFSLSSKYVAVVDKFIFIISLISMMIELIFMLSSFWSDNYTH